MFKKIEKFEGVVEVGGREIAATYGAEGLTLKVDPTLAMELLAVLSKAKLSDAPRRSPKLPKVPPLPVAAGGSVSSPVASVKAPKAKPAEVPATPTPTNGTHAKAPLETPDELRTKREAKEQKEKLAAAERAQAEDETLDRAPLPDAIESTSKKQKGAFVEDLDVHQAIDAAALVAEGKGEPPAELLKDGVKLRDVASFFASKYNLDNAADLYKAIEAWHPHLPVVARINKSSLKQRVTTLHEAMQADNGAA